MRFKRFTKSVITFLSAVFFTLLLSIPTTAQPALFSNNGAMVYVNNGGVMYVDGIVQNNDSIIINLGEIYITEHFVNNAQTGGDGSPLPGNHGTFYLWGDWRNNDTVFAGTGLVKLEGDTQYLTGSHSTWFYDLELAGTGLKIQTIDQYVDNELALNDRELWTDQYDMEVMNTNLNSITRTTGFVSSLENGRLIRHTLNNDNYLFPVGSSLFDPRYRPVKIKPSTINPNVYGVRMINTNPNTPPANFDPQLHDDSVCYVSDRYWYRIDQIVGSTPADIQLTYTDQLIDAGPYNGIAQWDSLDGEWKTTGAPFVESVAPPLREVRRPLHNNFAGNGNQYALAYMTPPPPEIFGSDELCADVATTYNINPQDSATYEFFVDNGTIVDSTATSITVIWNDVDSGTVTVVETFNHILSSCPSIPGEYEVNILSLPDAQFTTENQYPDPQNPLEHELITFIDSSDNTSEWFWDFGDGSTSTFQNPYHTYDTVGTYPIMMIATSPDGCLDTTYGEITVEEGIIIPNVFTPNDDGYNDVFNIRNGNVAEFKITIYNRWGTVIYETTAPEISWDGRTAAGKEASAGTYFYTVTGTLHSGNPIEGFEETGTITLLR